MTENNRGWESDTCSVTTVHGVLLSRLNKAFLLEKANPPLFRLHILIERLGAVLLLWPHNVSDWSYSLIICCPLSVSGRTTIEYCHTVPNVPAEMQWPVPNSSRLHDSCRQFVCDRSGSFWVKGDFSPDHFLTCSSGGPPSSLIRSR